MNIAVGIAGWSYPDWKGNVYPRGCKDELRAVARFVDLLEVNATFYAMPRADAAQSWVARTRDLAVAFTAKLPREFTHERRTDDELVLQARLGFQPLAEAGRLRALLAQFPHGFESGDEAVRLIERLHAAFDPVAPLVVELRHASWRDPAMLARLRDLGVAIAHLDWPGNERGFGGGAIGVFGRAGIGYFRLHGRNAAAWFRKGSGRDQIYDWEYTPAEVEELAARTRAIAAAATDAYVIANNHFHGKAMKVVLELLAQLRAGKVAVPDTMLARYPSLAAIAQPGARGLFG